MINNIFKFYLNKFVLIYLNDILIYFDTLKNYKKYLNIIFKKLKKNEFYIKLKKYNIEIETIKFYKYEFKIKYIKPVSIKINIIKN